MDRHPYKSSKLSYNMIKMYDIITNLKLLNLLEGQRSLTTTYLVRAQTILMETVEDLMVGEDT